jgi:hypothetical protein
MAQVCVMLRWEAAECARVIADPILGEGQAVFAPEKRRQPVMTSATQQALVSVIGTLPACWFCHGRQGA